MSKKEEKAREYIHSIFDCKMCDDECHCRFGEGYDSSDDCDCTADDFAEGFEAGWQAAMEYLAEIPWDEAVKEITDYAKANRKEKKGE